MPNCAKPIHAELSCAALCSHAVPYCAKPCQTVPSRAEPCHAQPSRALPCCRRGAVAPCRLQPVPAGGSGTRAGGGPGLCPLPRYRAAGGARGGLRDLARAAELRGELVTPAVRLLISIPTPIPIPIPIYLYTYIPIYLYPYIPISLYPCTYSYTYTHPYTYMQKHQAPAGLLDAAS